MLNPRNRQGIKATALITVACVAAPTLLASRDKQKEAPRQSNQGTRQNVAYLRADDPVLVSYRKAVAAMKKLPPDNPLSWQFQANMHGVPTVGANNDAWRWCMHGNWWFLPWHRGYLYHFE